MGFFNIFSKSKRKAENNSINDKNNIIQEHYFRNLNLLVDYEILLDAYCDISDSWNEILFNDDSRSLKQIHSDIQEILEQEYNENFCNLIKSNAIEDEILKNIVINLDKQYIKYKNQRDYIQDLENKLLNTL